MAGHRELERPAVAAVAAHDFRRRSDGKTHYARVVVSVDDAGALVARSAGGQGSHHLGSMALANGLAVLDDGEGVASGGALRVLLIEPVA
jgi:molybdopterin molybdotransferase